MNKSLAAILNTFFLFFRTYILDMQGFQYRNSPFIPKEITAVECQTGTIAIHFLLDSPIPFELLSSYFQGQIRWTTDKIHGIRWSIGRMPYSAMGANLALALIDAECIIVKGDMKKRCIESMLPHVTVINAENFYCPTLREIVSNSNVRPPPCCNHSSGGDHYCSRITAICLYHWLMENK